MMLPKLLALPPSWPPGRAICAMAMMATVLLGMASGCGRPRTKQVEGRWFHAGLGQVVEFTKQGRILAVDGDPETVDEPVGTFVFGEAGDRFRGTLFGKSMTGEYRPVDERLVLRLTSEGEVSATPFICRPATEEDIQRLAEERQARLLEMTRTILRAEIRDVERAVAERFANNGGRPIRLADVVGVGRPVEELPPRDGARWPLERTIEPGDTLILKTDHLGTFTVEF